MPSSYPDMIPVVVDLIWRLKPKVVLDLGCGYGKYGALFREYLGLRYRDQHSNKRDQGDYDRLKMGSIRIDAVEGWAPYIGRLHDVVYDHVYIQNIVDFCQKAWPVKYDFVLLCGVLEHFEKTQGKAVLETAAQRASMGVFVSLPYKSAEQGAEFGNTLEVHRSHWGIRDLRTLAPFVRVGRKGGSLIAFLTSQESHYHVVRGSVFKCKLRLLRSVLHDSW